MLCKSLQRFTRNIGDIWCPKRARSRASGSSPSSEQRARAACGCGCVEVRSGDLLFPKALVSLSKTFPGVFIYPPQPQTFRSRNIERNNEVVTNYKTSLRFFFSFFCLLGVGAGATTREIRKSLRTLSPRVVYS